MGDYRLEHPLPGQDVGIPLAGQNREGDVPQPLRVLEPGIALPDALFRSKNHLGHG